MSGSQNNASKIQSNSTDTSTVSSNNLELLGATPSKLNESKMSLRHRLAFNKRVFPSLFEGETMLPVHLHPKSNTTSSELSQREWQEAIEIVRFMGPAKLRDATEEQIRFRSSLSKVTVRNWTKKVNGVPKIELYQVEEYYVPGSDEAQYRLLRLFQRPTWNEPKWLICVPQLKVFDAIRECHDVISHLRQNQTSVRVHETYFNVTEKQVTAFVELCEVCNHQNPVTKTEKGAKKPILSENFRDRFQVDLIDMRSRPQKDDYGHEMKWIMTVKDHFTQFTVLTALPRKKASHVAFELDKIFGMIGFPNIFHTDNGTEFTAHEILLLLKKYNRSIITVTGRPRTPRDQGSVENMNKLVKRVIEQLENEDRLNGIQPNWTNLMGRCMQTINSKRSRERHDVSPYMAVYGQPYNPSVTCEHSMMRKCNTIEERLRVTNDHRLARVAEEVCDLGETNLAREPDDQYWEDSEDDETEKPIDMKNVDMEPSPLPNIIAELQAEFDEQTYRDANNGTGTQADERNHPHRDIKDTNPNDDTDSKSIKRQKIQRLNKRSNLITLKEAQKRNVNNESKSILNLNPSEQYTFLWPKLQCFICSKSTGETLIKVGDENYLSAMGYENDWYDIMMINSFGFMCFHWAHTQQLRDDIRFVSCDSPNDKLESKQLVSLMNEKELVSVFYGNHHYVVAIIDVNTHTVTVFDGLRYKVDMWKNHVHNILKRYQIVTITSKCKVVSCNPNACVLKFVENLEDSATEWTMSLNNQFVVQVDSINCGPLACLKLYEVFVDTESFTGLDEDNYRHYVIQRYVYSFIRRRIMIYYKTNN